MTPRVASSKLEVSIKISVASQLQILMDHLLQLLGPYGGTCVVYIYLGGAMPFILNLHSQSVANVDACNRVDCQWGSWEYGSCSVTCGRGKQTGVRRVVVQASGGRNPGKPCTGPALTERSCTEAACPGIKKLQKLWYDKIKTFTKKQLIAFGEVGKVGLPVAIPAAPVMAMAIRQEQGI